MAYTQPRTGKHYLIAGTDDGLFGSNDTGNGWRPINHGLPGLSPSTGIAPVVVHDVVINERNGDMFAGTDLGVFRRINRTKTWAPLSAGLPGADPRTGLTPLPVRSLLVFPDPAAGRTAVLAATDAGVFRREARGRRWETSGSGIPEGIPVRSLAAGYDPDGSLRLYAGTGSGLFRSADGGRNWERVGAPVAGAPGEDVFPAGINSDDVRAVAAGASGEVLAATPFAGFVRDEWPDFRIRGGTVDLAAPSARVASSFARIAPGGRMVLAQPEGSGPVRAEVYTAAAVARALRHDWERTGTVTRVEVARAEGLGAFDLRAAVAWVQEEELPLWEEWTEDSAPLQGRTVLLQGVLPVLYPEHPVAVSGRRARLSLAATGGVLRRVAGGWESAGLRNRGVRALAAAPDGTLFAAARGRGVLRSTDGGASWEPVGTETVGLEVGALAVTAGGRIAAGTPGGVRVSGDGGRSWSEAAGGIPEALALAAEADGELLAGTSRGVSRSVGGGTGWEVFGTGLPGACVLA
ncbi:MAG TPA: hypothetical protein VHG28_19540, partial [Longimicrobiaceae bacterium]|nr:hypothetical protein [Longimicrobiaceae bacterium]